MRIVDTRAREAAVAHCICAGTPGASGAVRRAYDVRLLSNLAVVRPRSHHTHSTAALSEQDATIVGRVETKPEGDVMDVQFIASIAAIARDPSVSRTLYVDALGLPLMGSKMTICTVKTSAVARASASGH